MSLHYLIDGYNLIKSTQVFACQPLAQSREALVRWLTVARPQGSVNNQVTVVFDGRSDVFGGASGGDIQVLFTDDGVSADDAIRGIVENHPSKKSVVVVSNDKGITLYSRALGARILSVEAFMSLNVGGGKPKRPRQAAGKYISHTQADAINQEFRKLWARDA